MKTQAISEGPFKFSPISIAFYSLRCNPPPWALRPSHNQNQRKIRPHSLHLLRTETGFMPLGMIFKNTSLNKVEFLGNLKTKLTRNTQLPHSF